MWVGPGIFAVMQNLEDTFKAVQRGNRCTRALQWSTLPAAPAHLLGPSNPCSPGGRTAGLTS